MFDLQILHFLCAKINNREADIEICDPLESKEFGFLINRLLPTECGAV